MATYHSPIARPPDSLEEHLLDEEGAHVSSEFDRSSIWRADRDLEMELLSNVSHTDERPSHSVSERSDDHDESLENARYASQRLLGPWFPEADPSHERAQTFRAWWSCRKVVLSNASLVATIVLAINITAVAVLGSRFSDSYIFEGDCIDASRLNSGIHILINGLSSLLLGASNLCMQLLSAPTRAEVDKAHAQHKWLDIGIPSIRNLRRIAWQRTVVWILLALSSLPLHVFFNSAVVNAVPQNTFMWAVVTPSFFSGRPYDITAMIELQKQRANSSVWGLDSSSRMTYGPVGWFPNPDIWRDHFSRGFARMRTEIVNDTKVYERLDNLECLKKYTAFDRDLSDVFLVSTHDTLDNSTTPIDPKNPLLVLGDQISTWIWVRPDQTLWQCGTSNSFNCFKPKTWNADPDAIADWNVRGYKIDYCLAKRQYLGGACKLKIEISIMLIVCIANAVKCVCIYYTAFRYHKTSHANAPLSTLGDAAVSFLTRADEHTDGMSLADRASIDDMWIHKAPKVWLPRRERWYTVSSKRMWIRTIASGSAILIVGLSLFRMGMRNTAAVTGYGAPDIESLGFGRPSQYMKSFGGALGVFMGHPRRAFYTSVVWANCWQLIISIFYVQFNTQLTAFLVGLEWSRFACRHAAHGKETSSSVVATAPSGRLGRLRLRLRRMWSHTSPAPVRKTLRVSAPVGIQRSSYFISMPWRYGAPLIITMSLLHWLMSQSLFVVASVSFNGDGSVDDPVYTSAYSLQAILATICVGCVLLCALFALGMRRYPGTIPLASTCSAAISATCHPHPGDNEAHLFPLQWGVVSKDEMGVEHCALSTDRWIGAPQLGVKYC